MDNLGPEGLSHLLEATQPGGDPQRLVWVDPSPEHPLSPSPSAWGCSSWAEDGPRVLGLGLGGPPLLFKPAPDFLAEDGFMGLWADSPSGAAARVGPG